jgi:hypothetical protein
VKNAWENKEKSHSNHLDEASIQSIVCNQFSRGEISSCEALASIGRFLSRGRVYSRWGLFGSFEMTDRLGVWLRNDTPFLNCPLDLLSGI